MTHSLTYFLAQERINDQIREARRVQRSAQLRHTRRLMRPAPRLRLRRPRPATA